MTGPLARTGGVASACFATLMALYTSAHAQPTAQPTPQPPATNPARPASALPPSTALVAEISRSSSKGRIEGLKVQLGRLPVQLRKTESAPTAAPPKPAPTDPKTPRPNAARNIDVFGLVSGTFVRPGWTLVFGTKPVAVAPKGGKFSVAVPITSDYFEVDLVAIGPKGQVEPESFLIVFDPYYALKGIPNPEQKSRWNFSLGLGGSYNTYSDVRDGIQKVSFRQFGLTAKGGFNYQLKPGVWEAGLSTYITVLPFGSSTGDTARFLGINLRGGYRLPFVKEPWALTVFGGLYYTTLIPSGDFGIKNMAGPQLFPVLRKNLGARRFLSTYLKFSPVSDQFSLKSLKSYEFAGGAAYGFPLGKKKTLAVTLDIAYFTLDLEVLNTAQQLVNAQVKSTSISLGVSMGF